VGRKRATSRSPLQKRGGGREDYTIGGTDEGDMECVENGVGYCATCDDGGVPYDSRRRAGH